MVKETTHVGAPPTEEELERPRSSGPRPVTTAFPARRGTGYASSGFGAPSGRTPVPPRPRSSLRSRAPSPRPG